MENKFSLEGKIVVITGGAGLLGAKHGEAVAEAGGTPVLFDLDEELASDTAHEITDRFGVNCEAIKGDVTKEDSVKELKEKLMRDYGRIDVLINNAAANPKMESGSKANFSRLENYSVESWGQEMAVGLTGAFICSKVIGSIMAEQERGVIVNISSDLGLIAPDQRLYSQEGLPENQQMVKPVTYSVIKHGLIGLTKYLATYWAHKGVRANALCPGGVYTEQPEDFVSKLSNLIPLGRMANSDEYKPAIQFLCSDASTYMNGACLVIDGGRTAW
jgi:NAD(P)-dependent dehydrogenase (short-subunit alcohol dehydrogenase family)